MKADEGLLPPMQSYSQRHSCPQGATHVHTSTQARSPQRAWIRKPLMLINRRQWSIRLLMTPWERRCGGMQVQKQPERMRFILSQPGFPAADPYAENHFTDRWRLMATRLILYSFHTRIEISWYNYLGNYGSRGTVCTVTQEDLQNQQRGEKCWDRPLSVRKLRFFNKPARCSESEQVAFTVKHLPEKSQRSDQIRWGFCIRIRAKSYSIHPHFPSKRSEFS